MKHHIVDAQHITCAIEAMTMAWFSYCTVLAVVLAKYSGSLYRSMLTDLAARAKDEDGSFFM